LLCSIFLVWLNVFAADSRRKSHYADAPPILPDISRVTSIRVLGVIFTNHVSISEHVGDVICRCAQSLYAMKVLRSPGMNEEELRLVFKTVVLAKILYATPTGWGLPQLLIGNELRLLSVAVCGLVSTGQVTQP